MTKSQPHAGILTKDTVSLKKGVQYATLKLSVQKITAVKNHAENPSKTVPIQRPVQKKNYMHLQSQGVAYH